MLPLLAALPADSVWERQTEVTEALRSALNQSPQPKNYAQVLDAASSFNSLMREPRSSSKVLEGLHSSGPRSSARCVAASASSIC